jgi:FkbM family methyltransferase
MQLRDTVGYLRGLRSWRQRICFVLARVAARLRIRTAFFDAGVAGRFVMPDGSVLDLRPGLDHLIAHPGHERETHAWIAQHIGGHKGVMLDVGGYIGTFALKHRFRFDRIFVFEPFPANYEACVRNVRLSNATDQIIVVPSAVSDKEGDAELSLHTNDTHSLVTTGREKIRVQSVTLDTFLERQRVSFEAVRLLKADVEGAEPLVLRGAEHLLRQGHPIVVVEALSEKADERLTEHLAVLGYSRVARLDGKNVIFKSSESRAA